jgi:outer membrane protein OmpA-like peptidoglycan-associated protein
MMKRLICILLLGCLASQLSAQVDQETKPSTLVFHIFYNDFNTAQEIQTTSSKNILDNHFLSKIGDMQMGFGLNYIKGIRRKIDFVSTLDVSSMDYLFKDGTTNGSSKLLLDANTMIDLKLLTDTHSLVPFLSGGVGISSYTGKTGVYIPVGAGLQFNLNNEVFVLANIQCRIALSSSVNNHFQYSIGIGVKLDKKKKIVQPKTVVKVPELVAKQPEVIPQPVIVKIPVKNFRITITDEQTGLPLSNVEVVISGPDGKINGFSDVNGEVVFNNLQAADYIVNGVLNGINTTSQHISKSNFDGEGKEITIRISHNDPRFTLVGRVYNKSTRKPEGDAAISIVNTTQNNIVNKQSNMNDGNFSIPLETASDFTISCKKAGYISNIEKVTTKGLVRNTTLYVKLELDIEETLPGKTISLQNIYYDLGSTKIRPEASSDLEKLVKYLKDNPDFSIEIASHTDSRGSAARNLILSQARAQEVVNYLQKNGIAKNRLIPKGYGETRLVNGCKKGVKCTEEQHAQNRRTEFKVIGN